VHVPRETRQFLLALPAQRLVIMILAANAFRRRQFMIRTPGQQPSFHILVPNVVTGLHLPVGLLNLRPHALLVGNVGFDGIGDEEIRTSAGLLRQLRKTLSDGRLEPDTERCTGSVRHKHFLAHLHGGRRKHFCECSISRKVCLAPRCFSLLRWLHSVASSSDSKILGPGCCCRARGSGASDSSKHCSGGSAAPACRGAPRSSASSRFS